MSAEAAPLRDNAVVAVVVTRHRRELLADSLKIIAAQTHPVDHLVVVDNGPDQPALGMLHALSLGADWVWLADDDGRPADENVLAVLFDEANRRDLAEVSPVVA